MASVVHLLKEMQLHPIVDHFTVAILIVAVIADLIASLLPPRSWLHYMALTLMIVGAFAAVGSKITGGWEADRVWKEVTGPGKALLKRHAAIGDYLAYVFVILAIWRILVEGTRLVARIRWIYLIVAVIAVCFLGYQGYIGGKMVYTYGIGTALMAQAAQAKPAAHVSAAPAPMTTHVPPEQPSPTPAARGPIVAATPAPKPAPTPVARPTPAPAAAPTSTAPVTPVTP